MKRPNRNELLPKNNFQGTYKRYRTDKEYIEALEKYIDELEQTEANTCVIPDVTARIDFKQLRDKFFKECVGAVRVGQGGYIQINLAPHDLFEWFKKELSEYVR